MTSFFNAVSAVLMLFLLMAVGYLLGRKKWLTASEKKFLSRFVVNVAVPANCVVSMLDNLDRSELVHAVVPVAAGTVSICLTLVLGAVMAQALKLPRSRWGVFTAMVGTSNTIFVGLPVTIELFGAAGVPSLMLYFLPSATLTQTVVVALIERAGAAQSEKQSVKDMALELLTKPPVVGILAGILLVAVDQRPPDLIMNFLGYISSTVTPLALIYCGFVMYEVGLSKLRLLPGLPLMLFLRLIISPMLCYGVCRLFGVTGMDLGVFTVIAALPVVSQIPVMAGDFGADEEYAATGACLSMLGCFLTLPILMLILK